MVGGKWFLGMMGVSCGWCVVGGEMLVVGDDKWVVSRCMVVVVVMISLLGFYILATPMLISGLLSTCTNVPSQ